jgi:hypothetical protein
MIRATFLWLAFACIARSETPLILADLPSKYFCFTVNLEVNSKDISKCAGDHAMYAVDGAHWRMEAVNDSEKGFVATYDGAQLRSTKRKLNGAAQDKVADIAPTSWLPKLFKMLRDTPFVANGKSSLEGMKCERYSLHSESAPIELYVHTDTRLPIQIITRISDSAVSIQRFIWLSRDDAGASILPTDMTYQLHDAFAEKLNERLKALNQSVRPTGP